MNCAGSGTNLTPKDEPCPFCSSALHPVFHLGAKCPQIKSIEYFKDGTVKKVEFN